MLAAFGLLASASWLSSLAQCALAWRAGEHEKAAAGGQRRLLTHYCSRGDVSTAIDLDPNPGKLTNGCQQPPTRSKLELKFTCRVIIVRLQAIQKNPTSRLF